MKDLVRLGFETASPLPKDRLPFGDSLLGAQVARVILFLGKVEWMVDMMSALRG